MMTIIRALIAAATLISMAAPAWAQRPATEVSGLVIDSGPGPKVVASFPADGASVPGGVLVLKVTFNQPMTADSWAYGRSEAGAFPQCLAQPRLLADQRTFVLLCTVAAHQTWAMAINPAPNFVSAAGRSAQPIVLHFTTSEIGVTDMQAALEQAGLSATDDPIMARQTVGATEVSRSAGAASDAPPQNRAGHP